MHDVCLLLRHPVGVEADAVRLRLGQAQAEAGHQRQPLVARHYQEQLHLHTAQLAVPVAKRDHVPHPDCRCGPAGQDGVRTCAPRTQVSRAREAQRHRDPARTMPPPLLQNLTSLGPMSHGSHLPSVDQGLPSRPLPVRQDHYRLRAPILSGHPRMLDLAPHQLQRLSHSRMIRMIPSPVHLRRGSGHGMLHFRS